LELFPSLGKSLVKSKKSLGQKSAHGIKSQTQTEEGRATVPDKTTTVHRVESNRVALEETTVLEMTVVTKTTAQTEIEFFIQPHLRAAVSC
jgi:hypothetical protein